MVRLVEFQKQEVPYDLAKDVKVYMLNDKDFYRKNYYPCMTKLQAGVKKGTYDIAEMLEPMVREGCAKYAKKYDVPTDQFDKEFVRNLINDLAKEEMPRLRKGEY